ncbi:MAG: GNAT family N-acetyltransferase [Cucumibacter sp.]
MDTERQLTVTIHESVADIPAADWNACAGPGLDRPDNPFLEHAFFSALESSGSARAKTGWLPQHISLADNAGAIVGLMPCYLKSHSQGEYVFDHGWAEAFERSGGRYYPKLQVSVPFTPVPAPKLLVRDPADDGVRRALLSAAENLARQIETSSIHATFLPETEQAMAVEAGWLPRLDQQFHWSNQGFASFEDFLGTLASRKRKAIRRERREALADELSVEWMTGTQLTERHWDRMFAFYMETGGRKWGRPYLNRKFFALLGESMADRVLLIFARDGEEIIAGALNLIGADTLHGRYWGCSRDVPFLHFELCYYQAIDFAIAHRLGRVEAGAQGEHKLARGYVPQTTWSAHWIAHAGFRAAVADYLERERRGAARDQAELSRFTPYHRG